MSKTDVILIRNANQFDFGGAEKYQILLAKELLKHHIVAKIITNHQLTLQAAKSHNLPHSHSPWLQQQNFAGWRLIFLPLYVLWQVYLTCFYLKLFHQLNPRVIHLQSRDDFIAGTIAARMLKLTIIWTDHADFKHLFLNTSRLLKNPIGKIILRLSRHVHCITLVSESERQAITNHISPHHAFWGKVKIIHNGAVDQFYPHQPQTDFIFGMVCRLVEDKGIREAIEAFTLFQQSHSKSQLWIIGDGPGSKHFQSIATTSKIKFIGFHTHPLALMRQFNCFLQPTYHEALSLSLVEACMMQLPIITTNIGGNPEVIKHKTNGLLIQPKSVNQLYQAMIHLYSDQQFAQKLAINARKTFIKKFDFQIIVKNQIIPIYCLENDKI